MSRTPDNIAADFDAARKRANGLAKQFAAAIREMGELLAEAEKIIAPEHLDKWLSEDVRISRRLAHHYWRTAEDKPFDVEERAVRGALGIHLADEIIVPDEHHLVRATDVWTNRLFIWPAGDGACWVMVFGARSNKHVGVKEPIKKEHVAEFIAENMRLQFEAANASFDVLPATEKDIAALDDMRVRHLDKEDAA